MEFNNNIIKYSLALSLGLLIGWVIQPVISSPSEEVKAPNPTIAEVSTHAKIQVSNQPMEIVEQPALLDVKLDEVSLSHEANTETEQEKGPDMTAWSGEELIGYIGSLDEQAFWAKINSDEFRLAFEETPRLFDELMLNVLDLQDKAVSRRLLHLFERINTNYSGSQIGEPFIVEEWIMQRVESENRSTEWLTYMSKLGVQSKDSYLFLSNRLRDYADPSQTTAILSILARKPRVYEQSLTQGEVAQIDQIIEPFFSADNDEQRMFAVASLSSSTFEKSSLKLAEAMADESRRVRMTAMRVVRDNGFDSPEISKGLMTSLSDTSLSAYERLGAYEVLARFELSQEQYERVTSFAIDERAALEQEFLAERQAAQALNQ